MMTNLQDTVEGAFPSPEAERIKIVSFEGIDYEVVDRIFQVEEKSLFAIAAAAKRDPKEFFVGRDFRSQSLSGVDVRGVSLSNSDLRNTNLRSSIIDRTTNLSGAILDSEDRYALIKRGILRVPTPKHLISYRIFIASPGGLEAERREAYKIIRRFTEHHAVPRGVYFNPIGWEDTLPGHGRPQALINADIMASDYAIFFFHDRWGSSSGKLGMTGVEEEFQLAEQLYDDRTLRNIVLLFKAVDPRQMKDPGPQLEKVLNFKKTIEAEKRYLFKSFDGPIDFGEIVEECLARWLRDHESMASMSVDSVVSGSTATTKASGAAPPDWAYWIGEAERLEAAPKPDWGAILYCRTQATRMATSDAEWVEAEIGRGVALAEMERRSEALAAFQAVQNRATSSGEPGLAGWSARALVKLGVALAALGRSAEAIAVYDDVVARFAAAPEPGIRERVAMALVNKGVVLGTLGRGEEAIAAYDDVVARFAAATEPGIREAVASALVNKGVSLDTLGRSDEAIGAYDDIISRFATATEPGICEAVAMALFNKGVTLHDLGRSKDAIAVLETCIARSGGSSDSPEREWVDASRKFLAELRAKPKRGR